MNEINLTVENNCLSPILCDALEIEQVIINLIINAVDAIKSLEKKWIKIHVSENTESVILRVIDSGFGIPEKIGKKMFEPFFTTKGLGHGTGLGMSIIKKILQEHNATINVDLFKGNTCFEIHFPKIDKAISKALNLYYLDDERELCINFLETFSTDKVMIHIFTNPNQLLSVVQESPPDLIFIDYLLTDTTGDKVAEMIDNKIPKILLTGEVNPTSSYKFDKIISKPFKEIEIINILENYQKGTR